MGFTVHSDHAPLAANTVVAPTGYYRGSDGSILRDGTPSPEMGPRQYAYIFHTHRSAARVANTLHNPRIQETL